MDEKTSFWVCLLLALAIFQQYSVLAKETEVRALVGTNVILPCRVDVTQCGILHSVKWYRDSSRIYVFSQAGQVARGEGDAIERMTVSYNETKNETQLQISKVKVNDEATYKCEITYLEVGENCDVVQIVKLTTLVKPAPAVLNYNGKTVASTTKLEEKDEGTDVELTCTSERGKPTAYVTWYNGTTLIDRAIYSNQSDGDGGIGTGISRLKMTLGRGDLNARFECRVESPALEEPEISWITVRVKVRPTKMKLSGVKGHVVQGSAVRLTCEVFSAWPRAEVRWYNGSDNPITSNSSNRIEIQNKYTPNGDGTFTTTSHLIFVATRWDNGKRFDCYGENEVMKDRGEPALHELIFLDVRYPPVITVSATNTMVNESTELVIMDCTYFANPQQLIGATWIKDGKNITKIIGKHEHANIKNPTLRIRNITREDMGEYYCWLKNEVGSSQSEDMIFLDVLYAPDVEIIMRPSEPVKSVDRQNVSLECNVTSGNPPALRKVRWFLGGDLMAELPECNYSISTNESIGGPFCGIDPSILSLIKVEESFAGNYTCQGENEAGIGPVSEPKELIVYYPPSPAKLQYRPKTVVKKGEVTLECTVADPGRPSNVTYQWRRNGHVIHNVTISKWTIPQASLETRSNFSCTAKNEGGDSASDFQYITVVAPPTFIRTLNTNYMGVLYNSNNVSLTCRIECYPLCSIIWLKDGQTLNTVNNILYYVNVTEHDADYGKNDFESTESTLVWDMKNWPGQQLDKNAPHSNYTCVSVSKEGDPYRVDVNFTTTVAVDFPPENLNVTKLVVDVVENEPPETVKCSGYGRPKLNYFWKNATMPEVIKGDTLELPTITRGPHTYTCEAWNKYANKTIDVNFNVLYKPECTIQIGDKKGTKALICNADANPKEMIFLWKIREYNETSDFTNFITDGQESYVLLDTSIDAERFYQCMANNSVGPGKICEMRIPGNTAPWYIGKENLIVIIASIIALIICVIVICIVIIVLCRRKRQNTKSPNPSSTGDKMRLGAAPPVGGTADPANDHDKGFYENLPFHGMQNPPNKPYRPEHGDLEYADVDFKYGPINYKAASIYAAMKKNKNNNKMEEVNGKNDDLL